MSFFYAKVLYVKGKIRKGGLENPVKSMKEMMEESFHLCKPCLTLCLVGEQTDFCVEEAVFRPHIVGNVLVVLQNDNGITAVSKSMLQVWGVTEEVVYDIAYTNFVNAAVLSGKKLAGSEMECLREADEEHPCTIYMFWNEVLSGYGASIILLPEALQEVYRELGCSYYLVPTSTRAVMAVRCDAMSACKLQKGLVEMNFSIDDFFVCIQWQQNLFFRICFK